MIPNSDPEGQIFLSTPNSYDRFFFLHTLPVFTAFDCFLMKEKYERIEMRTNYFLHLKLYIIRPTPELSHHQFQLRLICPNSTFSKMLIFLIYIQISHLFH